MFRDAQRDVHPSAKDRRVVAHAWTATASTPPTAPGIDTPSAESPWRVNMPLDEARAFSALLQSASGAFVAVSPSPALQASVTLHLAFGARPPVAIACLVVRRRLPAGASAHLPEGVWLVADPRAVSGAQLLTAAMARAEHAAG